MIHYNNEAINQTGIPNAFAIQFQRIADSQNAIIMSRACGMYATDLIEEGYASKGFHIKAKSCNWGPMAGFVNVDPFFSKAGIKSDKGLKGQKKAIDSALIYGSGSIGLTISNERLKWLITKELIVELSNVEYKFPSKGVNVKYFRATLLDIENAHEQLEGDVATIERAKGYVFALVASLNKWDLYYLPQSRDVSKNWRRILSLTSRENNPKLLNEMASSYRHATTGDFDLMAVWPYRGDSNYEPEDDKRLASSFMLQDFDFTEIMEDAHTGNMTDRLIRIRAALNEAFIHGAGYQGGDMVHHSDEAGRPGLANDAKPIDELFIVFIPNAANHLLTTYGNSTLAFDGRAGYEEFLEEIRIFIKHGVLEDKVPVERTSENISRYRVLLNPAWADKLNEIDRENDNYRQYTIPSRNPVIPSLN